MFQRSDRHGYFFDVVVEKKYPDDPLDDARAEDARRAFELHLERDWRMEENTE